ncbi:MAG: Crp/Fnr family transcriptional regulator [Cyclobacteriaceae bacterium]
MKVSIQKFDFQSDKILSSLAPEEQQAFLDAAETLTFKKGKLIFYEGGIPTGVFLIKEGKAKIYKTGLDGKDQIFYIYKAGDLMGYHALLCNEHYEDSCEALETCDILFVSKPDFDNLLLKISKLQLLLIQNMSHEFGVMVNTITVMAHKPLRERLALYLLVLQERYRSEQTEIILPREDLANIVGTARESLGRLLKEFKEDGLIEVDGRAITIKQPAKLQKVASSEYS